jgi:hypothetical protein
MDVSDVGMRYDIVPYGAACSDGLCRTCQARADGERRALFRKWRMAGYGGKP